MDTVLYVKLLLHHLWFELVENSAVVFSLTVMHNVIAFDERVTFSCSSRSCLSTGVNIIMLSIIRSQYCKCRFSLISQCNMEMIMTYACGRQSSKGTIKERHRRDNSICLIRKRFIRSSTEAARKTNAVTQHTNLTSVRHMMNHRKAPVLNRA